MTDKPDYMQKADESAASHRCMRTALARTLEALDTERAAQEATKAELLALREGVADLIGLIKEVAPAYYECTMVANARSLLPAPEPDPLVPVVTEALSQNVDMGDTEFAAAIRASLTRHGLTITAIGGKP